MRPPPQHGARRSRPAGPGSLAARPDKQAGKCVYKSFKLWINFSGVCVCVSLPVVIFQKSGLLEIFSLKLERNLNSLRAGGARGGGPGTAALAGLLGFPLAGPRTDGARSSAPAQPEEGGGRAAVPGLVSGRASLSVAVDKSAPGGPGARPIPGSRRCSARPISAPVTGTGAPGRCVRRRFPGISRGQGDSHPAEGCEGRCDAPREGGGG